jgi:hypothetical protein
VRTIEDNRHFGTTADGESQIATCLPIIRGWIGPGNRIDPGNSIAYVARVRGRHMLNYWRATIGGAVMCGSGCCHQCGCCDCWHAPNDLPPPRLDDRPPPSQPPPAEILPPVGPRPGTGAYGGS